MKVVSSKLGGATIELSVVELMVLNNALNEAIHELDEWEFPIRVGASVEAARALREAIGQLMGKRTP